MFIWFSSCGRIKADLKFETNKSEAEWLRFYNLKIYIEIHLKNIGFLFKILEGKR